MISRLIILSSFVLFVHFSFGQQKIDWAKYDCAVFKEDTTFGFPSRSYYNAQYHIPPDITESAAILELRVVPIIHLGGDEPIRIFQFYEDSTVLTEYYPEPDKEMENFIKKYKDSSSEAYNKGMAPLWEKTGGRTWRIARKLIPVNEAKKMIAELTKMNLFTIDKMEEAEAAEKRIKSDPRYSEIIKNHQLIRNLIRSRSVIYFEIKYKNKYRVFSTGSVVFSYYDNGDRMQTIQQLKIASEFVKYLMPEEKCCH